MGRESRYTMNGSGVLMIDESGTLKVNRGGNNTNTTLFNVSNEIGSGINTRAVLEDSGNFVLYDNATENRIVWQSFDHPTDTLLPGMKLGYNLTTGQNWTLTSWFSDQIPGSGAFTLRFEQFESSTQLVIYRRGKLYWSSGPWLYGRRFELEFSAPGWIPGTIVYGASGLYFSIQTQLSLSSMGVLMDGGNNPAFVQSFCYRSNESHVERGNRDGGCAVSALPNCRRKYNSFHVERGDWWSGSILQKDNSSNISLSDCMERCWNDCNCMGFSTNDINGTGCITWGGDTQFAFIKSDPNELFIGVLISDKTPKKKEKTGTGTGIWIWIRVSVVASVLTCAIAALLLYVKRKREGTQNKLN